LSQLQGHGIKLLEGIRGRRVKCTAFAELEIIELGAAEIPEYTTMPTRPHCCSKAP